MLCAALLETHSCVGKKFFFRTLQQQLLKPTNFFTFTSGVKGPVSARLRGARASRPPAAFSERCGISTYILKHILDNISRVEKETLKSVKIPRSRDRHREFEEEGVTETTIIDRRRRKNSASNDYRTRQMENATDATGVCPAAPATTTKIPLRCEQLISHLKDGKFWRKATRRAPRMRGPPLLAKRPKQTRKRSAPSLPLPSAPAKKIRPVQREGGCDEVEVKDNIDTSSSSTTTTVTTTSRAEKPEASGDNMVVPRRRPSRQVCARLYFIETSSAITLHYKMFFSYCNSCIKDSLR